MVERLERVVALAQMNAHVGNLKANLKRMVAAATRARREGAHLVIFPELVLTGYPPEDLLQKPLFLERLEQAERELRGALISLGIDAIYGSVRRAPKGLYNAGVVVIDGREVGYCPKRHLPNYEVFDERRYFIRGKSAPLFEYGGLPLGVTVCEDIWHSGSIARELVKKGAAWIININASPYHVGKQRTREEVVRARVAELGVPVIYLNTIGGQDELVFDGGSFVCNHRETEGEHPRRMAFFQEDLMLLRAKRTTNGAVILEGAGKNTTERVGTLGPEGAMRPAVDERSHGEGSADGPAGEIPFGHAGLDLQNRVDGALADGARLLDEEAREIYAALCLGLKDYVRKNGFRGVVLGLSGGIDSALTAIIAADALGPERVQAVMMPSPYTARDSLEDAAEGARRLGISLETIAIDGLFDGFRTALADAFAGAGEDVTEENIQPRIRATLLMALSNKRGHLLVTTGNKSEMSVGYATLYGDMAGGYSVLKDLLKERVFALSQARNRWAEEARQVPPMPERIITKPPSAELKPDQRDTDSLPPYPVLDRILKLYVEEERGLAEIIAQGVDRDEALRIIRLVDLSEYKRRQAPPGVRISQRAFGKDRRYPITNGFRLS